MKDRKAYLKAWRAAHRAEMRAYCHADYARHRTERAAKRLSYAASHRAERAMYDAYLKFGEAVALDVWLPIWSGPCFNCGTMPAEGVDHIIPRARDGRNVVENLQPACLPCNQRKHY